MACLEHATHIWPRTPDFDKLCLSATVLRVRERTECPSRQVFWRTDAAEKLATPSATNKRIKSEIQMRN